jgi:superfamily II DNA or RNA helicase
VSVDPLRPGDVVRIRDERWRVTRLVSDADVSVIEVRGSERSNRDAHTRFILPFEPLERLSIARAPRVVRPARWRRLARETLSAATPAYDALRAAARADISILPFQLEPALAVVRGRASRILIADEVGLGKTIQAGLVIAELLERLDRPHVLVVVPAALRDQWRGELETRFHIAATIVDSLSLVRGGPASLSGAHPWLMQPVIVTSIDYIKRPETLRALETLVWDLVVFDEAHGLSTRSDRNAAAAALAERARTVMLLSATPHSGNDGEFARLCSLGDLEGRFPLLVFRRTRSDAGLHHKRRSTWLRVRLTSEESRLHEALLRYTRLVWRQRGASSAEARLAAMVLARRACSSATSLTRSLERRQSLIAGQPAGDRQLSLPLDGFGTDEPPDAELGAPGLHDTEDERQQLAMLVDLAHAAQPRESKLHAVRRLLRRAGEPAIVFTEYRDTLARLASDLDDLQPVMLHGGLSTAERTEALQAFTAGRARLLLATDAASEGLNLHHRCRLVINLELPWTPRRLEQRVGRVERIGQARRVHAVHLVAAKTYEETTLAALTRRKDRAHHVSSLLRGSRAGAYDVARAVLGGDPLASEPVDSSLPEGLCVTRMRDAARGEAGRILLARRLGRGLAHDDLRPFVCARRTPVGLPGAFWTFRLEFLDTDDRLLWESLLAVHATVRQPPPDRWGDLRSFVDQLRDGLSVALAREHLAAAGALHEAMGEPRQLARRREHAIVAAARRRCARLAARLVQPSLFDRRSERQAADQFAALNALLSRCEAHLSWLGRSGEIRAGSREPAFVFIRFR